MGRVDGRGGCATTAVPRPLCRVGPRGGTSVGLPIVSGRAPMTELLIATMAVAFLPFFAHLIGRLLGLLLLRLVQGKRNITRNAAREWDSKCPLGGEE